MKTFQQFMEDQSKNPFIDKKTGRQNPGVYGHNPPIHGLASGNKYANNVLDNPGKVRDQYYQEPEVMKFFRDNDNNIRSTTEGPSGVQTKRFTNPFVVSKKGTLPKG